MCSCYTTSCECTCLLRFDHLITNTPYGLNKLGVFAVEFNLLTNLANMYHDCIIRLHEFFFPDLTIDLFHTKY